jgi:hypothetical protein
MRKSTESSKLCYVRQCDAGLAGLHDIWLAVYEDEGPEMQARTSRIEEERRKG